MFGGLANDLPDSPVTLLPAFEEEQLSAAFKKYVNIISASHDENNVAFLNLINEEFQTKGLLDITDVFDFEEDNDEIGRSTILCSMALWGRIKGCLSKIPEILPQSSQQTSKVPIV
jgi:hypothetical protein